MSMSVLRAGAALLIEGHSLPPSLSSMPPSYHAAIYVHVIPPSPFAKAVAAFGLFLTKLQIVAFKCQLWWTLRHTRGPQVSLILYSCSSRQIMLVYDSPFPSADKLLMFLLAIAIFVSERVTRIWFWAHRQSPIRTLY